MTVALIAGKLLAESAAFIRASRNIADPLTLPRYAVGCFECGCQFDRAVAKAFPNCMQHFGYAELP